jgi:hypothetical protein
MEEKATGKFLDTWKCDELEEIRMKYPAHKIKELWESCIPMTIKHPEIEVIWFEGIPSFDPVVKVVSKPPDNG